MSAAHNTSAVDPRRPRARTISPAKLRVLNRREWEAEDGGDTDELPRPLTRGDCENGIRPCPFVSCRFHLYLDVNPVTGALKLNFPHLEPTDLAVTCGLDVADRGGTTLEEVGALFGLTRERIRQIELHGMQQVRRAAPQLAGPIEDPRHAPAVVE